ncbi:MAG: Rrf2 family transcriptional regulator, partial [Maribacter sp.]
MLSNSSKYAIKAVLYLALNSNETKKVMVKNIAGPINVPKPYIAKLLQELSKQRIISSTRGPKGGFYLDKANRKNSIMSIV